MSKDEVRIDMVIPKQTIKDLQAIAKSAGVKVNTVAKVLLATFLHTNKTDKDDGYL